MIQEYRKQSAEWMGMTNVKIVEDEVTEVDPFSLWQPDRDHNQIAMIEDKLKEQEHDLQATFQEKEWQYRIMYEEGKFYHEREGYDNDKRIAFMKAFMECLKQK